MLEHQNNTWRSSQQLTWTPFSSDYSWTVQVHVDIATLCEVRFPEEGSLQEHNAGYTLFWSGKTIAEGRLSDVGFMVSTSMASRLENLSTDHFDRTMSMHLPLKNKRYATLFSVYAPIHRDEPAEKDKKRSSHQAHLTQPLFPMRRAAFRLICSILERSKMSGGPILERELSKTQT